MSQGYVTEGCERLKEILALAAAVGGPAIRRRVLPLFARLACHHGDHALSLEAYAELLAAQRSAGDRYGAARTLVEVANVHYLRSAYTDAWACFDASRQEAGGLFDMALEGVWRLYGGMAALCEGRYELARTLATGAVTAFDSENKPLHSSFALMTLGKVDLEEGRFDEASAQFLRALEVALEYGDRTLLAHLLEGFSGLATALGQHQRAVRLGGAAEARREADGVFHPSWQPIGERWLAISREALGAEAASAAWAAGRSLTLEQALEEAEATTVESATSAAS
jgi:tetratricopeptide (TPR) repeat protein